MADTIFDETLGVEITPYVIKTVRTPTLPQIFNMSLSGLAYVQTTGVITYQSQVDFIIHKGNDNSMLDAWHNVDLVKVVDDDTVFHGYIVGLTFESDYANGYHKGTITIQEEEIE